MTTYTTTATGTDSSNNSIVLGSTANMVVGLPITFSGTTFGGITAGTTYYIRTVESATQITISATPSGAVFALSTATGSMTATYSDSGQFVISTVPPGEPLNEAFNRINLNFDQLFAAGPVLSNIQIANNTIRTLDTNGNLVLAPNGIGKVVANVDILPNLSNVRNLGAPGSRWGAIYASMLDISGNINFANITVASISASGNIAAQNFNTAGNVVSNGVISNTVSAGAVTATGNITGGNVFFGSGVVSGTGNIYADKIFANIQGNVDAAGNLYEVQFNTTGDQLGASPNFTFDNSSNVLTVTGEIETQTITATGNVTSDGYFLGNGSLLTGIITSVSNINNGTSNINIASANANIVVSVDGTANVATFTDTGLEVDQDLFVGGDLSVVGNIYGNVLAEIPASVNIIYVAKNGSDSNSGKINSPFLTIAHAMSVATAGTSVHVAPGNYTEINPITIPAGVALIGDNLRSVAITPVTPASDVFYMQNGTYVWGLTIRNFLGSAFAYDPATPNQNVFVSPYIQNITTATTTGTSVKIDGSLNSNVSTKAMIVGFMTAINRGGRGIHILNEGYSQLVNIYTIACDIGIKVESGAFCTLNGSDCSIGNFGLVADGVGSLQTAGTTIGISEQGLFTVGSLTNGRPNVNTVMKITGDPNYYTIDNIIPINATTAEVYIQQIYTDSLPAGTTVEFFVRSSIIASAHTFEYVGAGTDPATALPQYGGLPIEANEVIQTNGGVITFTSTDQKGNFKVGQGFTINQAQGTITGTYFYKSLFAQMTPYILAITPD